MLIKSFIKSTIYGVRRNPGTTIIQIGGLVLALTVFLLITVWVEHEMSYDRFNVKADRIYRVEFSGDKYEGWVGQHSMWPIYMKEKIPEIENFVRFRKWGKDQDFYINYQPEGNQKKNVRVKGEFFYADSSFFSVFSFKLLLGDLHDVLKRPGSVVISDQTAKKLFGAKNPTGQTVNSGSPQPSTITGVYQSNKRFHIGNDWIVSLASLEPLYRNAFDAGLDNWSLPDHPTYLLLNKGADPSYVEKKLNEWFNVLMKEAAEEMNLNIVYHLRPLKEIYFNGATKDEGYYAKHGNKNMVIAFSAVGLFVLLVACINFINLSTAKSAARVREIGIRKVNGSTKTELVFQFLLEIFMYCLVAFLLSISLVQLAMPHYNNLIQGDLTFDLFRSVEFWLWAMIGLIIITILAGYIPSYFYSRLKPSTVLRDYSFDTRRSLLIRRIMLIGQYIVSTVLVIAVLVIFSQLNYMKKADPGFKKVHRIIFPFSGDYLSDKLDAFKERLISHPDIYSVTHCFGIPGAMLPYGTMLTLNNEQVNLRRIQVDEDYFKTLEIPVIAGRNFDKNRQGDVLNWENEVNRIILNETAVKAFKLDHPIGAIGYGHNSKYKQEVIGVVKDFHFSSLKEKIPPIRFVYVKGKGSINMIAHVNANNLDAVNKHLRETALYFFPELEDDYEFNYGYLEELYDAQYKTEERLGELFIYFTLLAILIACLGLYGLSSYSIAKRTREIAIRKANGALIPEIFIMVIKDYLFWITLAFIVALPVGYWIMNRWLQEFAYHVKVSWQLMVGACLITFIVAILTVLYQTLKAALAKPADALKYE